MIGIFLAYHLTLLRDLDPSVKGRVRLGQNSLVGFAAAAVNGAALAVKKTQLDAVARCGFRQFLLGQIKFPVGGEITPVFVAVRIAEHDFLHPSAGIKIRFVNRNGKQSVHHFMAAGQRINGFKKRHKPDSALFNFFVFYPDKTALFGQIKKSQHVRRVFRQAHQIIFRRIRRLLILKLPHHFKLAHDFQGFRRKPLADIRGSRSMNHLLKLFFRAAFRKKLAHGKADFAAVVADIKLGHVKPKGPDLVNQPQQIPAGRHAALIHFQTFFNAQKVR